MRVGMLTLMHGFNYGGMIQCLSLVETIRSLGHHVEVLNFNPSVKWRNFQRFAGVCLPPEIGRMSELSIKKALYGRKLVEHFDQFRNDRLSISPQIKSRSELAEYSSQFDALVVGSDQVWNTHWFTPEYFLDFIHRDRTKKISYAACFGSSNQRSDQDEVVKSALRDFSRLSVRNSFSQSRVFELCGVQPFIACDPTILWDTNQIATSTEVQESRYILLYSMSQDRMSKATEIAISESTKLRIPVFAIKSGVLQPWDMPNSFRLITDPTVEEWLALIRDATLVVTDSFHATIISVQTDTVVLNYLGDDPSSIRTRYIFERYGIDKLLSGPFESASENVVQLSVKSKMRFHAEESLQFLAEALR
jgi:polysaccharide pyruvyl transferase WcaK-like protein